MVSFKDWTKLYWEEEKLDRALAELRKSGKMQDWGPVLTSEPAKATHAKKGEQAVLKGDVLILPIGNEATVEQTASSQHRAVQKMWRTCRKSQEAHNTLGWFSVFCHEAFHETLFMKDTTKDFQALVDAMSGATCHIHELIQLLWPDYPPILFESHSTPPHILRS
jgi:hypothetical protein